MSASESERIEWPQKPENVPKIVDGLRLEHSARLTFDRTLLRLAFQRPTSNYISDDRPYKLGPAAEVLNQLGFNTIRKVVDAARARICRPLRPVVMPVGADSELERNCKTMTRAIDGIFDSSKYWSFHAPQVFADACRVTMGHLEWYIDEITGEVKCERGDPLSYFWHWDEGREPANLYAEYPASKVVLCAQFPQHKARIMALPAWKQPVIIGVEPLGIRGGETVRLCKAWRRRIGKTPGRIAAVAGNDLVLVDKKWNHDFFPVVACRWDQDFRGYGGYPGAAVLAPYQKWRNAIMQMVLRSLSGAVPWLLLHEDDDTESVTNVAFQKVRWSGMREPKVVQNNPVSPQLLEFGRTLDQEAHAEFGMNQQIAEGNMAPGVNSAPAQRERVAVADSRLYRMQDAWEQLAVDSARVVCGLAEDYYISNRDKRVMTKAEDADAFEEIEWPFDLQANKYKTKFTKMSGLSSTGWGKIQELGELRDRGAITESQYLRELELPNIQSTVDRITSAEDLALKQIESCLHDAKFAMPSVMLGQKGLNDAIDMGTQTYNRARVKGRWPAKNLECLRRYVQASRALLNGVTSAPTVMPVPAVLPGQPAGVAPMPSSVLPPMSPTQAPAPPVEPGPPAPPAPPVIP